MGFLKKIFGGKKKTKNEDGVGPSVNPSFPSSTASESRSGDRKGRVSVGISPSASTSTNGSNAPYSINTRNHSNRYNMTSPRIGDFGSPRSSSGPIDTDDEGIILADTDDIEGYYKRVRNQSQEELRIAYEKSKVGSKSQQDLRIAYEQQKSVSKSQKELRIAYEQSKATESQRKQNYSMLGDERSLNANSSGGSRSSSGRLTSNQLKEWDRSNVSQQQQNIQRQFSSSPTKSGGSSPSQEQKQQQQTNTQPQRVYTMSSALPSQQQFNPVDDMNVSESDASSFNLSTDAEDSEYESMKLNMRYPPVSGHLNNLVAGLSALDTSAIDTVGSITSYTTDGEGKIFPNLPTDDEMTLGTEASSKTGPPVPPSLLLQPLPNPLQMNQVMFPEHAHHTVVDPIHSGTADISMTNHHSPKMSVSASVSASVNTSANTSNSSIARNNVTQNSLDSSWTDFAADAENQPVSTKNISRNKPGGIHRNFTSPKSSMSSNIDFSTNDGFGNIRSGNIGRTNIRDDGYGSIRPGSDGKSNIGKNEDGFRGILAGSVGKPNISQNNDGFGNIHIGSGGKTNTSQNDDGFDSIPTGGNDDGFGHIRTGSSVTTSASNNGSTRNNKPKNILNNDNGFADFGNFASDFGEFSSPSKFNNSFPTPSKFDKGGAEWAAVKEEKKDQSWENPGNEFFDNTANPKNTTSSFRNGTDDSAWNVNATSSPATNNSKDDPFQSASAVGSSNYAASGSSSGVQSVQDTSLTELLDKAKSKRKERRSYGGARHSRGLSTGSVNSAPAITSSYLRQHHNLESKVKRDTSNYDYDKKFDLGALQGNSYSNNALEGNSYSNNAFDRPGGDGNTSVSDIIQNLEETRSGLIGSHRSMGDAGVAATARAAKERLRERRRREREATSSLRNQSSRDHSDSDDSNEKKNSESWLFDQVTGAMGPAGIAADLESLSGRSNRSRNSRNNAAGSRRNKSRKSGSRRHRSDRSVDSHGSKTSRYSHRSTKSFLSQMSEQSRSVANDLLRLEMQLAMVGNNRDANGLPTERSSSSNRHTSSASLSGTSRASRSSNRKPSSGVASSRHASSSSSSVVRRSRTTVVAPSGKLGIILANKADSKGTVVSGVRTSSVLVDRISPGDRIVAIDGEDVSRMTVSEITTIMSRKAEYERRLTILTATASGAVDSSELRSPTQSRVSPRAASVGGDYGRDFSADPVYTGARSVSSYRK